MESPEVRDINEIAAPIFKVKYRTLQRKQGSTFIYEEKENGVAKISSDKSKKGRTNNEGETADEMREEPRREHGHRQMTKVTKMST